MTVSALRQSLSTLKGSDGQVDLARLDAVLLQARDGGGIDAAERAELIQVADGFDDAARERLREHLSATGQSAAFVNVEVRSPLRAVEGRYAVLSTDLKGVELKLGLFDNTFELVGRPTADGRLELDVEGKHVCVAVKKGESPVAILDRVREQLPEAVTGLVTGSEAQLYRGGSIFGRSAMRPTEVAHLVLYKPEALGLKPGEKPLRVVVTGYGPFQSTTDNPSATLAQKLAEAGAPGAIVEYRRLDVTTAAVDAFIADMRSNPPDVILSMGSSSHSQVEERPENRLGSYKDGKGQQMVPRQIRAGGPGELDTDLPVEEIEESLTGFGAAREVRTSRDGQPYVPDRSAYLCNYLGYRLADTFAQSDATTAGFVHITKHTPPEQMQALLDAVVARQLEQRRDDESAVS